MAFLPLRDDTPRFLMERPYVTWGLVALCCLVFLLQVAVDPIVERRLVVAFGLVPASLTGFAQLPPDLAIVPSWTTLVTAVFLHGGWMHLIGNMLFLAVFGDNIEDSMGHLRFLVFFLICGVAAGLLHVALVPNDLTPVIGASGAISGILGAYLILHPRSNVIVLAVTLPIRIPAWVLLGLWFAAQLGAVLGGGEGNVAWWAHIGGFLAGAILIAPFRFKAIPLWGGPSRLPQGIRLRRRPRDRDDLWR